MINFIVAAIAVALAWYALRREFSRAIASGVLQKRNLLIRGGALVTTTLWLLYAVAGAFGRRAAGGLAAVLLVVCGWFVVEGLRERARRL